MSIAYSNLRLERDILWDMPMSTAPAGTAIQSAANTSETRFAFGKNWQRFLKVLNDERIMEAENSLRNMLQVEDLRGKTFIDIGSGSGLFSLAAMRLGAVRVHSFDYDPNSVACAQELRRRYFQQASNLDNRAGQRSRCRVYGWPGKI
jgi:2-polyprenyl-3-methyl-5-hydroxy-6-metoxy-1,4-benzoquinol methylase